MSLPKPADPLRTETFKLSAQHRQIIERARVQYGLKKKAPALRRILEFWDAHNPPAPTPQD